MPKRTDIHSILLIGSGPIVIGQACEFDYSGTQACKALKEEGYRVILVNSNPATIMTDPDLADVVYIEPLTTEFLSRIIALERPDALLPTMGGQTALNCALDLAKNGVLAQFQVEMLGASPEAIRLAEDRALFRQAMAEIGLKTPASVVVRNEEEALTCEASLGYPLILRPSFTLGGSGGGIAYNREELLEILRRGLDLSPVRQVLVEQSVLGWKELEMEVVRDKNDNCIIVCGIENFDAMGVHTGDSITVAPIQTLTDKEYQQLRNASFAVLRKIGVETGGSNVQFAQNPENGDLVVIEMNPRVSRSSALASKATGFPIAKVAALLAVGYTLDELKNAITGGQIPASFEPSLDYTVVKIPRFTFEKFKEAKDRLHTQMQSVGEVMAFGRTFPEALHKAMRSLEQESFGFESLLSTLALTFEEKQAILKKELSQPGAKRLWFIADAFREGFSLAQVAALTRIDPWFLQYIEKIVEKEQALQANPSLLTEAALLHEYKRFGFADQRLAVLTQQSEAAVRAARQALGIVPKFQRVDSCAAEFPVSTAYFYSTYHAAVDEAQPEAVKKVVVLGSGPNRVGQGVEFDYCCVQAAYALKAAGVQSIMINCNPETVSTDYDTADRLYFEPLTFEDVLAVLNAEQPDGVIVQYGGQTPLKLARELERVLPILGTSFDAIDLAEDRERFQKLLQQIGLRQPQNAIVRSVEEAVAAAESVGFPLVVRPSYVLGGRAMEVVYQPDELQRYLQEAVQVTPQSPVLLDRFLSDAIEVDVDALSDGSAVLIGGIMEHIEQAGVHSGDSACSLPPYSLSPEIQAQLRQQVKALAQALPVKGLMNVQFAIQGEAIYLLEVNPRAARTIPFVSKATGMPLARWGVEVMLGASVAQFQALVPQAVKDGQLPYFSVKEAVFPFLKFAGVDPLLGPEMKSTGEVMGVGRTFIEAFAKSQIAAGVELPTTGNAFISVRSQDKAAALAIARRLRARGFQIFATRGTAEFFQAAALECQVVNKVIEGRPHIVDMIKNGQIQLIINTTQGRQATADSFTIRREALQGKVCYSTTMAGAAATEQALAILTEPEVYSLQKLQRWLFAAAVQD
jgi:carbamoyl-phosphate synthase large subunit